MEKAEKYLKFIEFSQVDASEAGMFYFVDNLEKGELIKLIKQVQKDAWNEALNKAAENATVILHKSGKQIEVITPILKPQFYEKGNGDLVPQGYAQVGTNRQLKYENEIIIVDKESILKLKK